MIRSLAARRHGEAVKANLAPKVLRPLGSASVEEREMVLDSVFGTEGPFARAFAGYAPREGQIEFAKAVSDSIEDRTALLAEAGTGVGKSFGYLVPAVEALRRGGRVRKVIVATANIALQEQLVRKDLPTLQKLLADPEAPEGVPPPFSFALAKGFSNYVCQLKRDDSDAARLMGKGKFKLPMADERLFEEVVEWSATHETGDLSDFHVELPGMVKQLVTTSSEECEGKKCPFFKNGCFPRTARRKFAAADVVVTNFHMYFLNLEMRMRGLDGFLPEHEVVIFDEAHEVAEVARSFLGFRASFGSVRAAVEELDAKGKRADRLGLPRELDAELKRDVEVEAQAYFDELLWLRRDKDRYSARLNKKGMVEGSRLESLLNQAANVYFTAAALDELESEAREWLRGRAALCQRVVELLKGARALPDDGNLYYVDDVRDRAQLVREPLFPSEVLREHLFESPAEPRSIVLASATLTTGSSGDPFGYTARQVGVRKYDECIAASPFDYSRTAFVTPSNLPDPQDRAFAASVGATVVEVVQRARGRTLGLFTSYRVLEQAHRALLDAGLPYRVLRQGEAPRSALVKMFKEDPESVLLGTESFWTGVDVPGDSLLAVVIDRLPFDHFEDPVLDAIKVRDPNWFSTYYLPKAVIRFKQGYGRLVRSVGDRGVVVCTDRRVTSKGYGRSFSNSTPYETKLRSSLDAVEEFCWPEAAEEEVPF